MLTFFAVNGIVVTASQEDLASWIIRLSDDLNAEGLGRLLRPRLAPAPAGPAESDVVE